MTTTTERPRISRHDPETSCEVLHFYVPGDSETTPAIDYRATDVGTRVAEECGDVWFDSGTRSENGHAIYFQLSDEPDSFPTRVLSSQGLIGDWMLEETISTCQRLLAERAAMRS